MILLIIIEKKYLIVYCFEKAAYLIFFIRKWKAVYKTKGSRYQDR